MTNKKTKGGQTAVERKTAATKTVSAEARKAEAPEPERVAKIRASTTDLEALRRPVEQAKAKLEGSRKEAQAVEEKARTIVVRAKEAYQAVLAPYREACRKAGVECEYESGRTANVSEKVSFLVDKTDKGVRVVVKGRPETEEVIPFAALKDSINKAAYSYTEKRLGPKEKIGNKGGSLSNRLRGVIS